MIFVTGASGNVGREVVRELRNRHFDFRVGVRHADLSSQTADDGAVIFDFLDVDTFGPAVVGCETVFLLRPPALSNTKATLNVFLDVARRSGVAQVVFISVAGAASNPLVPHHAVEQHLRTGPAGWTILQPGFFTQNLGDAYRQDICDDSRIYLPAGSGRVAFIDVRDIAEVAVMALTKPAEHACNTYTLTGLEALSFTDVAAILTNALGRPIAYRPASVAGYAWHLLARGTPLAQTIVQAILHVGLRFGQAEDVSSTLARLLPRKPFTVEDYVLTNRHRWLAPQAPESLRPS